MNAQARWKEQYRLVKFYREQGQIGISNDCRNYAGRFRREAALERRIEALQRENAALKQEINTAKSLADIQDDYKLSDWIIGAQSEIANLVGQLRDIWDMQSAAMRGITLKEFDAMMNDETPLGIALDGLGDEVE
jgi:hypothetical protein